MRMLNWAITGLFMILATTAVEAADPIVIADFEGLDYGDWKVSGTAFGNGPARGTLSGQMHVEGYQGKGLVNSFTGGDGGTGQLTSPSFKIERKFLTFLIGGGGWADETCINLEIDGKVVRTATGPNTQGGGTERLEPAAWDVSQFQGQTAKLVIVDQNRGGWGHINVDQIMQTDNRGSAALVLPPVPLNRNVTRIVPAEKRFLYFPVSTGTKSRVVSVIAAGETVRRFDIELSDDQAQWWAPLDISPWKDQKLTLLVDVLPEHSKALDLVKQSDTLLDEDHLYREPLRSQFHFSPRRGWMNDPNGLVFYQGEYHLFFQHNPYGWNWGNMHWGHATSTDMVHWKEHGEALYPDEQGPMFSGSAVVDWQNISGFGKEGIPPLVLIYTAAGTPTIQCIAYSLDGRTFTKYADNPVVKQISGGNRDPKVFWHEPTRQWVMVLYVETSGKLHTVHIFNSPNLKEWTLSSIVEGGVDNDKYLFECPDLFELPIDGDSSNRKWVLTAANSEYAIGSFDGKSFTPELTKLTDVRGIGFYAAQTFSDLPDGRRVQIGWSQAPSPGMPFNQLQTIPCELRLVTTPAGVRLARQPIPELLSLRVGGNQATSLSTFRSELIELNLTFEPDAGQQISFQVRGARFHYDAGKQELSVNGHRAPAPLVKGRQKIAIFVDRTMLEVFASDGQTYVPLPFIPQPDQLSVELDENFSKAKITEFQVFQLKSAWKTR